MADAVTALAEWSAEDVRVGDILGALDALRREIPDSSSRTSVLTLVIVGHDAAAIERANAAVRELGGRHPARVLTLCLSNNGDGDLDGQVRFLGGAAEGHAVWFEEIALSVGGPVADHLDSLIEPFTVSDLPVVVWFVDDAPAADDPLLDAADVLMVDARALGAAEVFPRLVQLCGRRPVVDLSWVRLQPWRELLGGLFEGPAFRPFLRSIVRVEVEGKPGPRHLLGGWLADRLSLEANRLHLSEAEHVSVRLFADNRSGHTAVFEVARRGDERVVHAMASVDGGPTSAALVRLPEATPAWGLPDALSRLEHDPVYEHALRRAALP